MIKNKRPLHPTLPFFSLLPSQTNNAGTSSRSAGFGCLPLPGEECPYCQHGIDDPENFRVMIVITWVGRLEFITHVSDEQNDCDFELGQDEIFEAIFVLGGPRFEALHCAGYCYSRVESSSLFAISVVYSVCFHCSLCVATSMASAPSKAEGATKKMATWSLFSSAARWAPTAKINSNSYM